MRAGGDTEAARLVEAMVEFCWRHGTNDCYRQWPLARVRHYIRFHLAMGTLAWCRFEERTIAGVAVAWQDDEAAVRARLAKGHGFGWQPTNPAGDCVFVAEVVCRRPGALRLVIGWLVQRWPEWRRLKILTVRAGKVVRYSQRVVNLILRTGERRYEHYEFGI